MAVNKASLFVPLGVFVILVVVLALGFKLDDPHLLPSEMINRPFPEFNLPALKQEEKQFPG